MNQLISLDRCCTSLQQDELFCLEASQVLVVLSEGPDTRINGRPLPVYCSAAAFGPSRVQVQGGSLRLAVLSGVPEQKPGLETAPEGFQTRTLIFFRGLQNATEIPGQPDRYMISSVILQFLSHWHRRLSRDNTVAFQAARWLEEHCRENVTVQDLADALGYSRWHVMHCFSDAFSMSVHTWLMRCRMARVKEAIMAGDRSLEEIALDNGFSSRSALHKTFVRIYGITPGQYRRYTERNDRE